MHPQGRWRCGLAPLREDKRLPHSGTPEACVLCIACRDPMCAINNVLESPYPGALTLCICACLRELRNGSSESCAYHRVRQRTVTYRDPSYRVLWGRACAEDLRNSSARASPHREESMRRANARGVRVDECGGGMVVVGEEESFRLDSGCAREA